MKKIVVLICMLWGVLPTNAQYRVLHNFGSIPGDGSTPYGSLTPLEGKLYGMSRYGGNSNNGCIFSIDTSGANYKTIFSFGGLNGNQPWGNLTPSGKVLYGLANNVIFSIDTDGSNYRVLVYFDSTISSGSQGSLTLVKDKLYGMGGGGYYGMGVVFSVDTNGNNFKVLFNFNVYNGESPEGSLIYAAGVLYGMTSDGGMGADFGTVFSIDTGGNNFRELYKFTTVAWPRGALTRAGNKLYGMTSQGGMGASANTWGFGNIFSIDTDGNNYKDFFDFIAFPTGASPCGSLTLSGNKFYGMTYVDGGIFSIDTNGSGFDTIHDFVGGLGGGLPWGDVTISGNMLYGMTSAGGADGVGVIFSFNYVTAGVNELKSESREVKIYPNPSNGIFTLLINTQQPTANSYIEVYNILGQQVYQTSINTNTTEINLSGQPNGVYLYRVITETGKLAGEGKIVVQK